MADKFWLVNGWYIRATTPQAAIRIFYKKIRGRYIYGIGNKDTIKIERIAKTDFLE